MPEWIVAPNRVPYDAALSFMEARARAIAEGSADECVWLLEHPPLYTAGTSARPEELLDGGRLPVIRTGRGGRFTYHGPGQRIVYVMLDLGARGRDVRRFVRALESWTIATLAEFNVRGLVREGRVGVWVERPEKPRVADGSLAEDKIAAIGIRLRRWVSFHGLSINVDPNLEDYRGIVPCGISDQGVTSLVDLGIPAEMADVDAALARTFADALGD